MAKKARPAAGSPNAGKLNLDRVGTLATAIVDLMPKLLDQADWAVERGAEFRVSEPSRVDSMMNRTRKLLEALADLLTKAVPLERERMAQRPYQTEYGTRLEFREPSPSETKYQPGNWTESDRKPVRPLLSGQYPSVMDELLEEQALRPVVSWLYSARSAVLDLRRRFLVRVRYLAQAGCANRRLCGLAVGLASGAKAGGCVATSSPTQIVGWDGAGVLPIFRDWSTTWPSRSGLHVSLQLKPPPNRRATRSVAAPNEGVGCQRRKVTPSEWTCWQHSVSIPL